MEEKSVVAALGPSRFINREVSWIRFAERVVELAADGSIPLLERVKFLAIFSSGLDEFFQVRVAGLKDRLAASVKSKSSDGMSTKEQLKAIRNELEPLLDKVGKIYNQDIVAGLKEHGIEVLSFDELDLNDRRELSAIFEKRIFPVLTPIALDPAHPFPYISNLSLSLLVTVSDPISKESRVARVKVPAILPRFVPIGDANKFVTLESVIAAHLNRLFPEMEIGDHYSFRVTRNADLSLEEEEADDLLELVEIELRRRRFGRAVRVEVSRGTPATAIDLISEELRLHRDDIYEVDFPIDLSGLWQVHSLAIPEISAPTFTPTTPLEFSESNTGRRADIFEVLRGRDILLHHPYTSFSNTVEAFIEQAALDPNVLAIKQTLYRTSGDSRMMAALIRAAEAGKQVAVLVELKARFDELANISWAKRLEEAGVHVVYGLMGLKTHIKAALVIRNEDEGVRLYCHLGTGNYNAKTARSYEDLGLLSADSDLNRDLAEAFNLLTGFSRPGDFSKIVLAPTFLRNRIMELIDEQAQKGEEGRIVIKVNNLTDSPIIDALYNASNHGVTIDIIARGICCLRPGVPGLSENIRVKSIVGKLLEHSRIYAFGGSGEFNPFKVYVGSADLMERNLDRRIEAIFPISQASDIAQVEEILKLCEADDLYSWTMNAAGFYERDESTLGISVQDILMEKANLESRKPAPSLM